MFHVDEDFKVKVRFNLTFIQRKKHCIVEEGSPEVVVFGNYSINVSSAVRLNTRVLIITNLKRCSSVTSLLINNQFVNDQNVELSLLFVIEACWVENLSADFHSCC